MSRLPKGAVSAIDVKLRDFDEIDAAKERLSKILGQNFEILSWKDLNKSLFKIMDFERIFAFLSLSLIIVIAAFNSFASLVMTVIEKRRDISVLRAMGVPQETVKKIFSFQGIIIGLIGAAGGTLAGLTFCFLQAKYGFLKMDAQNFLMAAIPIKIDYIGTIAAALASVLIPSLAAVFPAKEAAKTIASEHLRLE